MTDTTFSLSEYLLYTLFLQSISAGNKFPQFLSEEVYLSFHFRKIIFQGIEF